MHEAQHESIERMRTFGYLLMVFGFIAALIMLCPCLSEVMPEGT